ncbi:hypothetical protein O7635_21285 [Asanoa sp. WMMD1127]|uniref:hypothetical protein n=1 Tax=Asanoa sp. WMMD1127 TaxID=3016107 RepID=UPI0024168565|nr:hypothetical protein [Asanoa sp. WMMD1127]MDG4824393.1 hypothetical protein [Asanoa sp. WMMD1127]
MTERRPGLIASMLGTVVAAAGVISIFAQYGRPHEPDGILIGGVLVIAGLLLRIEGAIRAVRSADDAEPDPDPRS